MPDLHRKVLKERRLVNVVALLVPLINFASARLDLVPLRILICEIAIKPAEDFRLERRLHGVAHVFQAWPEIAQKSFIPFLVSADRLFRKIDIDPSGQREGHHQRRRHEKIGFDVLMHACFEISITGKDRRSHEIKLADRLLDLGMQRARVADARRATVTNDIETQLVEIGLQPGFREVVSYDARPGGK